METQTRTKPANKEVPRTIGDRIKRARESILIDGAPMSQGELARRVGVERSAVSQWENGTTKSIKGEYLFKLVKELRVSVDYLLHGKEGGGMEFTDKAYELAHAWDDMPDGEWKERVYYFVTTFLVFQKQLEGERKITQKHRRPRRPH